MIEQDQINAENEKKRQELTQAYKRLFMTDDGRTVLRDLESFCGFHKTSVNQYNPNSFQTFFAEGQRRVYLRIDSFLRRKTND
jgi:hypothetical protein